MKLAACLFGACSLIATPAFASHPHVHLEVDACTNLDAADVARALEIELGEPLVDDGSAITRASVGCEGARLRLSTVDGGRVRSSEVSPPADATRARVVGIAVFELVSAGWIVTPPVPEPIPVAIEKPRIYVHELDAVAFVRGWWSGPGAMGGAGLRYALRLPYHLGLDADLLASGGHASTAIGRVDLADVSARIGLLAHKEWSRVSVFGSLGLRLGGLHFSGTPKNPQAYSGGSGWGTWLGPSAIVGVGFLATSRLRLGLLGEVGDAARPVRGLVSGGSSVSYSGAWLTAELTIGVAL
ncbi:MAG: hypothetical protein ABI321_17630 [Polyangia bacterium]